MSKYIGIFVFVFSLFSLGVHAGESFRFRVYLKDKGDSGYTLDNPEEYLSKESVERRSRQGISVSESDLPIAQAYLDTLSANGGKPVLESKWFSTVVVSSPDSLVAERLLRLPIVDSVKWVWKGDEEIDIPREEKDTTRFMPIDKPEKSPYGYAEEQIKMLNGIFENYARIINSRLNARLRFNGEITVESIEEQRYYEFSNALTEGDVLALVNASVKGKAEDTPVMFYLSTTTALSMMDRLLGGDGAVDEAWTTEYSYTDLELRLYEDLVNDMVSVMGSSWENYIPIQFSYSKTDVNPTLSQIIGLDEIVIIVDMKMQFSDASGRMSICLPGEMLSNIFAEISKENPIRKAAAEDKAEEIFDSLRDSTLEIVSTLGQAQLSLRDIYHLNVGDVIDLGRSKQSSIYLDIGGYHWFTGKMGTHKKNMAVRIDEVCYQAEQRSEEAI